MPELLDFPVALTEPEPRIHSFDSRTEVFAHLKSDLVEWSQQGSSLRFIELVDPEGVDVSTKSILYPYRDDFSVLALKVES